MIIQKIRNRAGLPENLEVNQCWPPKHKLLKTIRTVYKKQIKEKCILQKS